MFLQLQFISTVEQPGTVHCLAGRVENIPSLVFSVVVNSLATAVNRNSKIM